MTDIIKAPDHTSSRNMGLDVLRAVAVLLVIIHHVGLQFPDLVTDSVSNFVVRIGWSGVDVFFSISGFLIVKILWNLNGVSGIKAFFVRRFYRIFPLYFAAVTFFLVVSVVVVDEFHVVRTIWINFLFLTSWLIPFLGEEVIPYTITWSVSVEEFSYLLLGGSVFLGGALLLRRLLIFCIFFSLTLRVLWVYYWGLEPNLVYFFFPTRIDSIAMGGIGYLLYRSLGTKIVVSPWLPASAVLAIMTWFYFFGQFDKLTAVFGYTIFSIFSTWLVICIYDKNLQIGKVFRFMSWLPKFGLISYFVYLSHVFLIGLLAHTNFLSFIPFGLWSIVILVVCITYIFGILSWRFFEEPLINYGKSITRYK